MKFFRKLDNIYGREISGKCNYPASESRFVSYNASLVSPEDESVLAIEENSLLSCEITMPEWKRRLTSNIELICDDNLGDIIKIITLPFQQTHASTKAIIDHSSLPFVQCIYCTDYLRNIQIDSPKIVTNKEIMTIKVSELLYCPACSKCSLKSNVTKDYHNLNEEPNCTNFQIIEQYNGVNISNNIVYNEDDYEYDDDNDNDNGDENSDEYYYNFDCTHMPDWLRASLNSKQKNTHVNVVTRRTCIPPRPPNSSINLWNFLKNCVGKDLGRIAMPVNFFEPLSMLQRLTEDFEYSSILDNASNLSDNLEQMAYIAVFAVASYASISNRIGKPFNPIQGETFECDRTDDFGWRSIAEQISHHPPTAAMYCEGTAWQCWQEVTVYTKFKGTNIRVIPEGSVHLKFSTGKHYYWRKVQTMIKNIIIGKLYAEPFGTLEVHNCQSKEIAKVEFVPTSMFSKDFDRKVMGSVLDQSGNIVWKIHGTWDKELSIVNAQNNIKLSQIGSRVIWSRNEAIPDQRLMEEGFFDLANEAKAQLEDQQRYRLGVKKRPDQPENTDVVKVTSLWFSKSQNECTDEEMYTYNGKYWENKLDGNWSMCPSLFAIDLSIVSPHLRDEMELACSQYTFATTNVK
ncbi:oxysterol-binding protein 1-like isoform X2 [Cimex lectularius]|uniref:Oxysterol-binding protein n=1 Tax=Cimex lectularius TaxID=79782 RepID=A0A8I6RGQ0_CIMLE|nr:oxysterol-binding protein 1-like isoform X2 [Cimex lectularius]